MEVITRITPSTLTIAIVSAVLHSLIALLMFSKLMDSMDWMDPGSNAATQQVVALNRVLKQGGRVLFRSASRRPWYTDVLEEHGFEAKCVGQREPGKCIDR